MKWQMVSLETVWGATWWRQMDKNIKSQRLSVGFRSGKYQFLHPPRNSLHTLPTWNHVLSCTRRNPGATALVPVVRKRLCSPPYISLPRLSLTHHQTGHTEQYYRTHSLSRHCHVHLMCSGWTHSHLWKVQATRVGPVNYSILWQMLIRLHGPQGCL